MMRIRLIIQYAFFLAFLSGSMIYAVTASFSSSIGGADEDATCQVTINFDAPAWGSVTYDVSGTSTATAYGAGGYYDYNLSSNTLEFTGEESYTLNLNVYNEIDTKKMRPLSLTWYQEIILQSVHRVQ